MTRGKKMIVAIDCDDVVVETGPAIIGWYNKTYGTRLQLSDFYGTDDSVWGVEHRDTAIERVNEYLRTDSYINLPPVQEAKDVLAWLSHRHELHLVTGRADFLEAPTAAWLKKQFGDIFSSLEFTNYIVAKEHQHKTRSKADVCRQLGADILIDDHLHHAEQVAQAGIPVILFGNYPWNQAETLPGGVSRLKDWSEIRGYFAAIA